MLLIDGEPVPYALARIPLPTDNRGNLAAGAKGVGRELNERDRWLAAEIGPALAARGMVFVGLDVIGGFVTEINVTSPTGIREIDQQFGLNIGAMVIEAFERRIGATQGNEPRALQLREGIAPTRDRLTTTVFMAALVHGVIIVGVTFGSTSAAARRRAGPRGADRVRRRARGAPATTPPPTWRSVPSSARATTLDPAEASSPRGAAELAASQGRADGTRLMDEAGALLATADGRVLTTSATMPEILYFAPPASLTESPEVPVHAEGTSDRDKLGIDDDEEQKLRGPQRDELWLTPDTREALVAPYLVAWRTKIERLGTMNFPQAAWRAPGTRNPDVEVVILADGTLESANVIHSSGSANSTRPSWTSSSSPVRSIRFPKELSDRYRLLRFTYGWEFEGGSATDAAR